MDIEFGGGHVLRSIYSGSVRLSMSTGSMSGSKVSFVLDVLYIPDWHNANLISWRKLDLLDKYKLIGQKQTLEI